MTVDITVATQDDFLVGREANLYHEAATAALATVSTD